MNAFRNSDTEKPHILIVEDEQHLAIGIKYNLQAEGYRVSVAGDGPTALKIQEDDPAQLLVLDLMLPGMSGYAVCERLRESGSQIPVLILSARTLTEDRTRGFDVGADQYLMKPFELDELLSRVRNLLNRYESRQFLRKPPEGPSEYAFGETNINFQTFEVTAAGEPLRLTQMEMKLLRYFTENEGRVIPRAELLEEVWDLPGNIATRAPDQFIRRLRKYFEPNPAEPVHFLTIRDAGYRFVAAGQEA